MGTPPLANLNLADIEKLPISEQRQILRMLEEYSDKKSVEDAKNKFIGYARYMFPRYVAPFVEGRHHREMAKIYDSILRGELKRVIISLAPRHSKSEFASWLHPSFYLGHNPNHKVIQVSNTAELAAGFGRRVRDTMESEEYKNLFGGVTIKADSRSAGRWNTSKGGDYYATGVGGALAGRGAHILNIDDPHSESDALLGQYNPKIFDDCFEWYGLARQRLQPGGVVIITATRWSKRDLTGQVLAKAVDTDTIDDWKEFTFPAIFEDTMNPLWPEYWSLEELLKVKKEIPPSRWLAQYQQALALDTPIPTPTGWSTIENLKVGDFVIGSDGKPTVVTWKSAIFKDQQTYKVISDDGASVIADGGHLWSVRLNRADSQVSDYNTEFLYDRQKEREENCPLAPRRPRLPEPVVWECPELDLPLDPWCLGAWLGDGDTGSCTMNAHDMDMPHMMAEFERRGFKTSKRTKQYSFGVLGMRGALVSLGILKHKRIPEIYKRASARQRLELLQGLVDTDGTVSRGRTAFASVRTDIIDDVCELVLSLGAKPFVKKFRMNDISPQGNPKKSPYKYCYKVEFYLKNSATMPRKVLEMRGKKTKHGRFLKFEKCGFADTQCIRVGNPDGLFLAGKGGLLTHNCPTTEGNAIIKREDWKPWDKDRLPSFSYIIDSWDTAFTSKTANNYSARTRWGVFYFPDADGRNKANVMLIDSFRDRLEFPALKAQVKEDYGSGEYVDLILVEGRGSGLSLIDELHYAGFPVEAFTPARKAGGVSNDKVARANNVADIFRSGVVWYNTNCPLNDVTIEECSDLPRGDSDDLADTVTQAIQHLRDRAFIGSINDTYQLFEDDEVGTVRPKGRIY